MTATDELRRLLDERGVEWEAWNDRITVALPATHYLEITDGSLCVAIADCTPAQAVEATLGRETCYECADMEDVFECSACGMRYEGWALKRWARYCPNCGRKVVDA